MAKGNAVWGIDIGQCALKALRCTYDAREDKVVADAFDFIEYPKILSQPDADPESLVRDAIKEFRSRHDVRGDKVAISVAGQQGLARFIKLPPVEAKKLPKIVEYEAKQQIPFALEDVIWDYQMLVGGGGDDGVVENEVGLFAMKREQVFRAIRPLDDVGVEIDVIQLTPVAIFNAVVHNVLGKLSTEEFDPNKPPESVVVLSMGTDTTDLVVTNGFRVWQRSIPLGGNHFTKQLTKELKLTFGKAEHLKRNSREAEDPKKVFQAMRPVFNDMVQEVQRSIGFFESLDRSAKIGKIVGLGNAFKLPGLEPYLEKNLGHKVEVLDAYPKLTGPVLEDKKFKKNAQSMGVCYGLALQGLGKSKLKTNLVPRELVRARVIRRKKPWVLAAASCLMAALSVSFLFHWNRAAQVEHPDYTSRFSQVSNVSATSGNFVSADTSNQTMYADLKSVGDQVVGNGDRRLQMLELMKAINSALPREDGLMPGQVSTLDVRDRPVLYIESVESEYFGGEETSLTDWWTDDAKAAFALSLKSIAAMKSGKEVSRPVVVAEGETTDAAVAEGGTAETSNDAAVVEPNAGEDAATEEEMADVGELEGNGWVIELVGYHYHNERHPMAGAEYVRRTIIKNLIDENTTVTFPDSTGKPVSFTMKELGISHALLAYDSGIRLRDLDNPDYVRPNAWDDFDPIAQKPVKGIPGITARAPGSPEELAAKDPTKQPFIKRKRQDFKVQFVWRPTTFAQRMENRLRPADLAQNTSGETDQAE